MTLHGKLAALLLAATLASFLSQSHAETSWGFRGYKAPDAASLCATVASSPLYANCGTHGIRVVFSGRLQPVGSSTPNLMDCRLEVRNCRDTSIPPKDTYVRVGRSGSCDPHQSEDSRTRDCLPPPPPDKCDGTGSQQGNPIDVATGIKRQTEVDFAMAGPSPLAFIRSYQGGHSSAAWGHNFESKARYTRYQHPIGAGPGIDFARMVISRPGHGSEHFSDEDLLGSWVANSHTRSTLENIEDSRGKLTGWRYTTPEDTVEEYDLDGKLVTRTTRNGVMLGFSYATAVVDGVEVAQLESVSDSFGNRLSFTHDSAGHLATMTDPAGGLYRYSHNSDGLLESVTYPDGDADPANDPARRYHYEQAEFPWALTGITDERGVRFANYAYDSEGRAIMSEHANGAGRIDIAYSPDDSASVTNSLGRDTVYHFERIGNAHKLTRTEGIATPSCLGTVENIRYDARGYPDIVTDANGHQTDYDYDARGLITRRVDALGSIDARVTLTEWHPRFRLPIRITRPELETAYSYDASGNPLTVTQRELATGATRVTTRSFNRLGQILTLDGPRADVGDVTTYTYHECTTGSECGQLETIVNALGHVTTFDQYNAVGQPTHITDANGIETILAYDARYRLLSSTVDGVFTTTIRYDRVGQVTRITAANGSHVDYEYDDARRLRAIQDAQGNRIEYDLDSEGNRSRVDVRDAGGLLRKTQTAIHDELSRVLRVAGANGQTLDYTYDHKGNRASLTGAGKPATSRQYDALDRLIQVTDANAGVTRYSYDQHDRIRTVTDPNHNTTVYSYNAFGDRIKLDSPDTGSTLFTLDSAGNVASETDASGRIGRYSYDALNRRTSASFNDPSLDITWVYDENSTQNKGIGHLTTIVDGSGTTAYRYDSRGLISTIDSTIGVDSYRVSYTYDSAGNLSGITYPSGRVVSYHHDNSNRITRVTTTLDAVTTTLADNIGYQAFGPMNALTYGNNLSMTRIHDLDYRATDIVHGGVMHLGLGFDVNDRIIAISDNPDSGASQALDYDFLDRLISARGEYGNRSYAYDPNTNRSAMDRDGTSETYTLALDSNRLLNIGAETREYDQAGNTTRIDGQQMLYDARGRFSVVQNAGATLARYRYDANDRRVLKDHEGRITHYLYNPAGTLLAEAENGTITREYVWLNGKPLAVLDSPRDSLAGLWRLSGEDIEGNGTLKLVLDTLSRNLTLSLPDGRHEEIDLSSGRWHFLNDQSRRLLATSYLPDQGSIYLNLNVTAEGISGDMGRYFPPRYKVWYSAQLSPGSMEAVASDRKTGAPVRWSLDPTRRILHLAEHPELTGSWRIAETHWREWTTPGYSYISFSYQLDADSWVSGLYYQGQGVGRSSLTIKRGKESYIRAKVSGPLPTPQSTTTFLHTDHLGTPRRATDDSGQVIWRWDSEPFGEGLANEDPDGDGNNFSLNLRFPGQYYDEETGLHYNYYRYYEPGTGRYITSDPIGLDGGLNTYAYVFNNPINFFDPAGKRGFSPLNLVPGTTIPVRQIPSPIRPLSNKRLKNNLNIIRNNEIIRNLLTEALHSMPEFSKQIQDINDYFKVPLNDNSDDPMQCYSDYGKPPQRIYPIHKRTFIHLP